MKKFFALSTILISSYSFSMQPADLSQLESQQLYEEIAQHSSQAKELVQEASRSIASNPTWSKEDQKWLEEFQKILATEDTSI
jgi:hypothetical protein